MAGHESPDELEAESSRLIAVLELHGIDWRPQPAIVATSAEPLRLSTGEKVALFRRPFKGRTEVYPIRWESKTSGKSGYTAACANEWRAGVCEKPRIKCRECSNRVLIPMSDAVIFGHLAGRANYWRVSLAYGRQLLLCRGRLRRSGMAGNARVFKRTCEALGVPAVLEISRSGLGAHAWCSSPRAFRPVTPGA